MKVRMIRNPSDSLDCKLTEGMTGEVDDATGKLLVSLGIAQEIPQPKPLKAVPEEPKVAAAKPATIQAKPKAAEAKTTKENK